MLQGVGKGLEGLVQAAEEHRKAMAWQGINAGRLGVYSVAGYEHKKARGVRHGKA